MMKGMIYMSSFTCPYCNSVVPLISDTIRYRYPSFDRDSDNTPSNYDTSTLRLTFYKCPKCENYTISVVGLGLKTKGINALIQPRSNAKQFPKFVPEQIRNDYEEAYLISELSPKASATLSRRCIQGMIHDKWQIVLKNLNQEITALKDKIDPSLWSAIDSLRQLGNIGAHMEKDINTIIDIDPDEAQKLLSLVEILIREWYIIPHEREILLSGIVQINNDKQEQRKKTE